MGLNYYLAREVLRARNHPTGSLVATIGQLQHFMTRSQANRLCEEFGLSSDAPWTRKSFGSYGHDFLLTAGAERVAVIDASAYEGADEIHDMNEPVDTQLHGKFDLVIDGGSLEHIFRPHQALANVLRMARVGGSAIIWTPANNLCGHGFYQFSPEFFFSALDGASGFQIVTALVVECVYPSVSLVEPRGAYRVRRPSEVGARVGAVSKRPLMMLVRAIKTRHVADPLAHTPQQSDYVTQWASGAAGLSGLMGAVSARLHRTRAGGAVIRRARGIRERRRFSLRNRKHFTPE